ncbi:MAG: threonine--tRNA ligase [Firmicutes bacterium HGW-Firmicutes-5]|nr:MAG: threonine--tRNA ligase [Firmicutes bacterium HGW-Firmicutes-5]
MIITLKDGNTLEFDQKVSVLDIAKTISEGLARQALVGEVDGAIADLRDEVSEDAQVNILTFNDKAGKKAFWHSASHLLAHAVKRLYPETKLAIGPAIDNGFYYDLDRATPFSVEELALIEGEMKKIASENLEITRFELPREAAIELMQEKSEDYKVELIQDLPEDAKISFYQQGDFVDLCAGPHIVRTKDIKAFKLTSVAGAYWRGSEDNKMLTRIYGTAFPKAKDLKEYLDMIEEAKKRDHRKLGKELELFTMYDEGPGFPVFLNKGIILKDILIKYWKEIHKKNGYEEVSTPIILNKSLWETSGHWDHYRDNMYTTQIDDEDFAVKPMNCPGGMLAFKTKQHSYRDLPLRMGELGLVHRHEMSGALHGLMRVRSFTQDDAHIFMTRSQVTEEIINVINLIDEVYAKFGFSYHVELSTKPEGSIGVQEDWDMAEASLKEALDQKGMAYILNEGDGAFYGPKIDFHLRDCIGRTWQCGTIQLDFQLPQRFELEYIEHDNSKQRPIMLHRVVYGSIERFIGILIEHFAGAFPYWLAPVQVKVLPISPEFDDYAKEVMAKLDEQGVRVEGDLRNERIGYKIREGGMEKIPFLLIVGENERNAGSVSIRPFGQQKNDEMSLVDFIEKVKEL